MDRDTIIDGLKMTIDLFVFDPSTGEERDPDELNDLDRTTYDACKGALEILERLDTDSDTISRAKAIEALRAMQTYKLFAGDDMLLIDQAGAQTELMLLPPIQPAITHEQAIDYLHSTGWMREHDRQMMLDGVHRLAARPTIQSKRGRWHYPDGKPARIGLSFGVVCDQCGIESEYCTNFCGECGADMREVTE